MSVLLKALLLLVFLGGIAAATVGVQRVVVPQAVATSTPLRIDAVHSILNATTGHAITFDVLLTNRGHLATADVTVSGDGVSGSAKGVIVPAGSNMTAFVTLLVPDGMPAGTHALTVRATTETGDVRERSDLLRLRVLPTLPGFAPGASADLLYVGRIEQTGQVFNTNDPGLAGANFPKFPQYSFSPGVFQVQDPGQIIPGVWDGVQGIQAGESRTFVAPASKAYGPATLNDTIPRIDVIGRDSNISRERSPSRAAFDNYINSTQQGDPASYKVNDTFHISDGPNQLPYRILAIDARAVTYTFDAKVGDTFTIYRPWPNASVVTSVNDTTTVIRTTPTTAIGERITILTHWPSMSAVVEVTNDTIVVQHTPTVGFRYTPPATQQDPQPVEWTVRELTPDGVRVTTPNTDPLGGRDLTFDVLALSVTK